MNDPTIQLMRSRRNRMIAGVCGGIARRFGWDPTLVRLGYVLLTVLPPFPGLIVYIVLWIVMPVEPG